MQRRFRPMIWAAASLFAVSAVIAGCGDNGDSAGGDGTLRVLGSTSIVADWVEQVGGEHIDVESIVPANTDVHAFVLAPTDVRKMGDADLVFMVGAELESAFDNDIRANSGGDVIVLSEGMALRDTAEGHDHDDEHENGGDDDHDHGHGGVDPHIWMDIELAIEAVERISDVLVREDPDRADDYRGRTEAYIETLRELDEEIAGTLRDLPENRRYLVTFHDGHGYFAARYGLTMIGFVVENPDEQPSAGRYADLVDEIRERGVPFIYKEPQFDARVIEQLAADTGTEIRSLPSDTLSDDTPDYVSLMRAIASAIAE